MHAVGDTAKFRKQLITYFFTSRLLFSDFAFLLCYRTRVMHRCPNCNRRTINTSMMCYMTRVIHFCPNCNRRTINNSMMTLMMTKLNGPSIFSDINDVK